MPSYILKGTPDEDWYCTWSTVVDNCIAYGDREELTRCMLEHHEDVNQDRWGRADMTGSSSQLGEGAWSDKALIVANVAGYEFAGSAHHIGLLLPRDRLRQWVESGDNTLLLEEVYDYEEAPGIWSASHPVMATYTPAGTV